MSHSVFSPIVSLFHFETITHLQTVFRIDSHVDTSWWRNLYLLDEQNLSSFFLVITRSFGIQLQYFYYVNIGSQPQCKVDISIYISASFGFVSAQLIDPHKKIIFVCCLSFLSGRWRERDTLGMTSLPSCSRKGMTPRRPSNRRWSDRTSPVSFAWLTGRLRDMKWCDCVSVSVCVSLDSPSRYFCIS